MKVPDKIKKVPDITRKVPDIFKKAPDKTWKVPDIFKKMPDKKPVSVIAHWLWPSIVLF